MAADLPDLHDAVLLDVQTDYGRGVVSLRVGLVSDLDETAVITCSGFARLAIDREQPWGPSDSINAAHRRTGSLDIELQSGDHVVVGGPDLVVAIRAEDASA